MTQIDHNDYVETLRKIHVLEEERNELQHSYSFAKQTLACSKDRKRRLLALWIYKSPEASEIARKNWAMAQPGYIEECGKIEVQDLAAQQTKDKYEKIQPQLDMLQSQISYIKSVVNMR